VSGDHAEVFWRIMRAYDAGDYARAFSLVHPDVVWIEPREMPGSQTYHGHEGVSESLTKFWGTWRDQEVTHHDLTESGDRLYLRVHIAARGKTSGAPGEFDEHQVLTFEDGLLTRMEMFLDEAEARQTAGLPVPAATEGNA
jgi:ketosteroid isomerase-like protein